MVEEYEPVTAGTGADGVEGGAVHAPKMSVVIPVYNAERYLRQCLDSVLTQSLTEIEVICVDDGSTDGSLAILREYEERDPRVAVLTQTNQHAGPARNKGLEAATGEYVHFLDADDYVLPYAYEALYNKLVKYELDMIRCAAVNWDVERECFVEVARENLTMLRPGDFNRLVGIEEGSPLFKVSVAPWAGLYRRAFLMERGIRFNDLVCVNDRSFFAAVVTNAERMMIARDRLVAYRITQGSSLIGARARNFDCQFRSLECVVERMRTDSISMEVQERVLDAEFTDVLVWFKKYAGDPELGERIQEQMDAFVVAFDGPFAHVLRQRYRDAVKQLGAAAAPERLAKRAKVVHEACECPKVSVAVPIYNVEDYLNEALNSLTCQELEEMEFICVNDGSTDGSLTILREYAALDARFRILDGPNGGYGKGMNRAMDAARGEYLGILEPDDFVPANMFRELYRVASKNDVDFVKADFNRFKVNADGSLNSKRFRLTSDSSFYNRILCPVEELDSFQFIMNTWSGIYKLEFLRRWNIRHNETPGASYQDNGFWFQTFCRAERAYFVNKPYYMNRRDNPNSSMFSTGKMYCVTDEYRYIQGLLEPEQELWAKVERIFYGKKLSNFFMTYFRLAPELQREYLHHLKDEFEEPYERGLIDSSSNTEANQLRFTEIMEDSDAYYDRIRVSVIVPVYNAERYLRQMLDSVLVRNEVQFELIAVDDGSTDGSLAILREYEARDPRVRVITQANAGAGAARNAGMVLARGEYLSFLDADDFFESRMLRLAYDRAHLLDADVVVFRSDQYIEDTGKFQQLGYSIRRDLLPSEEPFAGADIQSDIFKAFVGWPWDKLFRTEFVREHGLRFPEVASSEDAFFVFSAIVAAERIATRGDVLAHHRRASGSLSVSREKSWGCFYEVLLALREQLLDMGLYERREQDFINYSAHWTLWNLNTLQGPAYYQLYDHLKSGWLAELGILSHDMGYFYNRDEWEQLQQLMLLTADEYLFWSLQRTKDKFSESQSRLQWNRQQRVAKESAVRELRKTHKQDVVRIKELRKTHRQDISRIKKLRAANKGLKIQNKKLRAKAEHYRSSTSWKLGRAMTWLPRKIKQLLKRFN